MTNRKKLHLSIFGIFLAGATAVVSFKVGLISGILFSLIVIGFLFGYALCLKIFVINYENKDEESQENI